PAELDRIVQAQMTSLESIQESLELLGVGHHERDEFLTATLLALRGWAGMLREVERRTDRVPHPIPPDSLIDYLAVRLILERLALSFVASDALGFTGPLNQLRRVARGR